MTIREHPLAWRWADPQHTVLTEAVLAQMEPAEDHEAAQLSRMSLRLLQGETFSPVHFKTVARQPADLPVDTVRGWLRQQQPDLSVPVVIAWGKEPPIRTNWGIFTAHWDAFCYPSSDDIVAWPQSPLWALYYHHEEEFQFATRA